MILCLFADEKEKFDPSTFADQIIAGLNEAGGDLELVKTFSFLSLPSSIS